MSPRGLPNTSTSVPHPTPPTLPTPHHHHKNPPPPTPVPPGPPPRLADSYHASFGTPVVTLRPFNTFGPRQSMRAVIPTVIGQVAAGQRTITLGDLRPTRDFTFVEDTAQAFLAVGTAAAERVVGRTFNAGTGGEISVGDLVALIGKVMDAPLDVQEDTARLRPAASEVMRLVADATRLTTATGWRPASTLEDGLARTARWFTDPANLARYKTGIYNI
ncbi:GDP-mannose 4,6-dehydratase, partial [Streptomyces sp. NPDC006356]